MAGSTPPSRCVMVPKPKATEESQLRPIGLLPMHAGSGRQSASTGTEDEVWHSMAGHGRRLASRARASMEVQQHQGRRALLAFLDYSKCYEGGWASHSRDPSQAMWHAGPNRELGLQTVLR